MWVYILFIALFLFVYYKERQALGCPNWPDGTDCDNASGKAVQGSKTTPNMSTNQILEVVDHAARFQNRWVRWRTSFMIALFATIAAIYIMYSRFPSEKELAVYVLVITFAITLTNSFYRFHLTDHVTNNIVEGVEILRSRQ